MTLTKELEKIQQQNKPVLFDDPKFEELQQFYSDMKSKGFIRQQKYEIPQINTIGHSIQSRSITNK